MRSLDERAREAKEKKAAIGPDIDLADYSLESPRHADIKNLKVLSQEDRERMALAGLDINETERAGTYIQKDGISIHSGSQQEGLEIIPIKKALEELDWIKDYYWKMASVDTDKYTARARLDLQNGYVIRALPGKKITLPAQACL